MKVDKKARSCVREEAKKFLLNGYNNNIYSAACLALSVFDEAHFKDCCSAVGGYGDDESYPVDGKSIFDLASLTKPLVTLPAVLQLIETGRISWTEPLSSLLETVVSKDFEKVDLRLLLSHSAGFCAHHDYWQELIHKEAGRRKKWLLEKIVSDKPAYEPGTGYLYSDLGYILLGLIVEKKSGLSLDEYWSHHIAVPAGVDKMLFFNRPTGREDDMQHRRVVSTGLCRWSGESLTGRVHDDNCRALGGVAGHAGLFGSAEGVLKMCKLYVDLYHGRNREPLISVGTFRKTCRPVDNKEDSEWGCGFIRPSVTGSSSGSYFSTESVGHLGFTGVSFWIDMKQQVIICLLTNRVIKGEDRQEIRKLRPELHDALMICLGHQKSPRSESGG